MVTQRVYPRPVGAPYRWALGVSFAATMLLAGCGSPTSEPPSSPSEQPSTTATAPEPTTPTSTDSITDSPTAPPSGSAEPSAEPPLGGLRARMLSAEQWPRPEQDHPWNITDEEQDPTTTFGSCQRFDLLTLGATKLYQRNLSSGPDTAMQQVARFPDKLTAQRTYEIVTGWQSDSDCAAGTTAQFQLKPAPGSAIAMQPPAGSASGSGSFGFAVSGKRLTILRLPQGAGFSWSKLDDEHPMVVALSIAAAKLR